MAIDFPIAPATNQIYTVGSKSWTYDGEKWVLLTQPTTLDSLSDVAVPSPTSGDFLKYNGTNWVNDVIDLGTDTAGNYVAGVSAGTGISVSHTPSEGSTATVSINATLDNLSDVAVPTPSAGQYLAWNGTSWVNSGIVMADISDGQAISTSSSPSFAGLTSTGTLTIQQIREKVVDSTISTNVLTCDYNSGAILYQGTAPSANFTVNITNAPTTDGYALTVSVFVTQGSTGYYPNALQVAGSAQTIKWAGGTAPTPTSSAGKIDLYTFTLIRRSSAWTVLGSANLNF